MNPASVTPRRNPEADLQNLKLEAFWSRTVAQDGNTRGEAS